MVRSNEKPGSTVLSPVKICTNTILPNKKPLTSSVNGCFLQNGRDQTISASLRGRGGKHATIIGLSLFGRGSQGVFRRSSGRWLGIRRPAPPPVHRSHFPRRSIIRPLVAWTHREQSQPDVGCEPGFAACAPLWLRSALPVRGSL